MKAKKTWRQRISKGFFRMTDEDKNQKLLKEKLELRLKTNIKIGRRQDARKD